MIVPKGAPVHTDDICLYISPPLRAETPRHGVGMPAPRMDTFPHLAGASLAAPIHIIGIMGALSDALTD